MIWECSCGDKNCFNDSLDAVELWVHNEKPDCKYIKYNEKNSIAHSFIYFKLNSDILDSDIMDYVLVLTFDKLDKQYELQEYFFYASYGYLPVKTVDLNFVGLDEKESIKLVLRYIDNLIFE